MNDFKYRVAQTLSCEQKQFDTVLVCDTPELVRSIGFSSGEIHISQKHIRDCLATEDPSGKTHKHDLPIDFMDNLPRYIEAPAMILSSQTQSDSIVLVTDCKDKKDRPIIIALKNAGQGVKNGSVIDCNFLTSTYGKDEFVNFLNKSLQDNGLLFLDIKKSRDLVASIGLQLPEFLAMCDSNVIIRRYDENVNTFKQKFLKNPKNYLPENYGQTLYRPDGSPIAYVDHDGRQRLWEYGTKEDGSAYVVKTTVTLSDGRSEVTAYDARGRITLLERNTIDGRDSYTYSSDGYLRASERFVELGGENEFAQSKTVHEKRREKKEERGYYYDHAKEKWEYCDERGNVTLSKNNVYGRDDRLYSSSEARYEYDRFGNVTSAAYGDGSVRKIEYYPPSLVSDYFGFEAEDYDEGAVDHDKVKTETARYADGSIRVKQYSIEGKHTESDYSPDGKLTKFRAENGEEFAGKAAELALLKSQGQAPSKTEAKTLPSRPSSSSKPAATDKAVKKQKPDGRSYCKGCKAKRGSGSGSGGGAGR